MFDSNAYISCRFSIALPILSQYLHFEQIFNFCYIVCYFQRQRANTLQDIMMFMIIANLRCQWKCMLNTERQQETDVVWDVVIYFRLTEVSDEDIPCLSSGTSWCCSTSYCPTSWNKQIQCKTKINILHTACEKLFSAKYCNRQLYSS